MNDNKTPTPLGAVARGRYHLVYGLAAGAAYAALRP